MRIQQTGAGSIQPRSRDRHVGSSWVLEEQHRSRLVLGAAGAGATKARRRQDSVQSRVIVYEELEIPFQERGDCPPTRRPPHAGSQLQLARARERGIRENIESRLVSSLLFALSVRTSSSVN